jgi:hypothetical protein
MSLQNKFGDSPLTQAAFNGVTALPEASELAECVHPHSGTRYFAGHKDVVEFLVQKGAQLEQVNQQGDTPLLISAYKGTCHSVTRLQSCSAMPCTFGLLHGSRKAFHATRFRQSASGAVSD